MIHKKRHCQPVHLICGSTVIIFEFKKHDTNKKSTKNKILFTSNYLIEVDSLAHLKCIQTNDIVRITRNDRIL